MSYDCYCDYDPPAWIRTSRPKARKAHECTECNGPILIGEIYENVAGMWDGWISHFNTCCRCLDMRDYLTGNLPCYCWAYGGAFEDAKDAIDDAYYRARDEVGGLWVGYARRKIKRDRFNKAWRHAKEVA